MKIGFALSFFQSCLLIRHGFAAPPSPLGKAFEDETSKGNRNSTLKTLPRGFGRSKPLPYRQNPTTTAGATLCPMGASVVRRSQSRGAWM